MSNILERMIRQGYQIGLCIKQNDDHDRISVTLASPDGARTNATGDTIELAVLECMINIMHSTEKYLKDTETERERLRSAYNIKPGEMIVIHTTQQENA